MTLSTDNSARLLRCWTTLFEISIMWLYSVPMAFLGSVVWKLPVHVAVLLKRYLSGKWLNNMIEDMQ